MRRWDHRANEIKSIWQLIKLRYLLLWAQTRTSVGRSFLLVIFILIGSVLVLFLNHGGFSVVFIAIKLGKGYEIVRLIFSGMFAGGIVAAVIQGQYLQAGFSENSLRYYPLSKLSRFVVRHLLGLLEPIWIFYSSIVLGIAVSYAFLDQNVRPVSIPAGILFILVSYFSATFVVSLIDLILKSKNGFVVLLAVVFFGISFFGTLASRHFSVESVHRLLNYSIVQYSPGELVAHAMSDQFILSNILHFIFLLAWLISLTVVISRIESSERTDYSKPNCIQWNNGYDQIVSLYKSDNWPLLGKSLRYHLRCNRVRYNLLITPPFILFIILGRQDYSDHSLMFFVIIFSLIGCMSVNSIILNHFGYDRLGVIRYLIIPKPLISPLLVSSCVSLLLGSLIILITLTLLLVLSGVPFQSYLALLMLYSGIAGLFFFSALGLWVSIYFPRSLSFQTLVGNHLSLGGNIVAVGGLFVIMLSGFYIVTHVSLTTFITYSWLLSALTIFCIISYLLSIRMIAKVTENRREYLIKTIARID